MENFEELLNQAKRGRRAMAILLTVGCLVLLALKIIDIERELPEKRIRDTQTFIGYFNSSCREYERELNRPLEGTLATVVTQLSGFNRQNRVFMTFDPHRMNDRDEPVDSWDTPFQLSRASPHAYFKIKSAGPDKVFGTPDDISEEPAPSPNPAYQAPVGEVAAEK